MKKNQLGPMTFIAKGGVGQVFRLTAPAVQGWSQPLAYKEILPEVQGSARDEAVHAMEQAVLLRDAMNAADQAELDRMTTWPFATVEEHGATIGTLMPLIPPEFFVTLTLPKRPPEDKVFAYAYLSAAEAYVQRIGLDRSLADDPLVRMSLAAQLAYTIGLLHKHNIVYGDMSLQNAAISLTGQPKLKLLDCDAAAALTDAKRRQYHSPAFKPPENTSNTQQKQDLQTDVYKLGLCILRSLVTGAGVTQLMDPRALAAVVDAQGVDLVTRALSSNRNDRPTAKELCLYLEKTVISRARPPVIHEAELNRRFMVRGQDVLVEWKAEGVRTLNIQGVNGMSVPIKDPGAHPNGYAITPTTSGPIFVEARNRYGTVSANAGYVELYDLPTFDLPETTLPRPVLPSLPQVKVPAILSALPTVPMVATAALPMPRADLPDLRALHESVHRRAAGDPAGQIAGTAWTTASALTHTVRKANDEVVSLVGVRTFAETAESTHVATRDAIRLVMSDVSAELHRRITADPPDLSAVAPLPSSSAGPPP